MKKKLKPAIYSLVIGIAIIGLITYIYRGLTGDSEKIIATAQTLEKEMEEKYDMMIVEKEGFYTNKAGYGAEFTTKEGIKFVAWEREYGSIDTYMEEVWRNKGLDRWGYAPQYISNVEHVNLNVGYRDEVKKDINQLSQNIEDIKGDLWLTLIVDLQEPYDEQQSKEIEQEIFNYYQQLQRDNAGGVELLVRYAEDSRKQDTGAYMIMRDENGRMPTIDDVESVAETLF